MGRWLDHVGARLAQRHIGYVSWTRSSTHFGANVDDPQCLIGLPNPKGKDSRVSIARSSAPDTGHVFSSGTVQTVSLGYEPEDDTSYRPSPEQWSSDLKVRRK